VNGNHVVEIDDAPFAAVDFQKVWGVFHMNVFGLGRRERSIILDVIYVEHHADERSFLLLRAKERNKGIQPSQVLAISGIDSKKRKTHVFASFPKQKVGKPQPLLFRFPLRLLAGFSAFSVPTSLVGRVLRFSFTIITEIHFSVNGKTPFPAYRKQARPDRAKLLLLSEGRPQRRPSGVLRKKAQQ
jgi:hypothetical protein